MWLLSEQPLHGYRIKKILDDGALRFWFPVEYGSIYAVLQTLGERGFVREVAVEREGRRPARTRYAITQAGRTHLQDLLRQAWRDLPSPADPLHLALAAEAELDEAEVDQLLKVRKAGLEQRLEELDALQRSAPAVQMVERERALTRAELDWAAAYTRDRLRARKRRTGRTKGK